MQKSLFNDISNSAIINLDGEGVDAFDLALYLLLLDDMQQLTRSTYIAHVRMSVDLRIAQMTEQHQKTLKWAMDWHEQEDKRRSARQKMKEKRGNFLRIQQERDYLEAYPYEDDNVVM